MSAIVLDETSVPDYLSLLRLDERAIVVLGGGNGIGRQVCHALAQAGAKVVCVDRVPELAQYVADEVGGIPLVADITKREDLVRAFDEATARLGPITGLVDVVGMPILGPFENIDDEKWDTQFDLVLRHAFLAMQIGGEFIAKAGGGTLVFIGSVSGNSYVRHQSAYGAAKAALAHLVATVGREFAPRGLRINGVTPGYTATPRIVNQKLTPDQLKAIAEIIPRGKVAIPAEIAGPVLFLSSALSSNIYGRMILADGGMEGTMILPPDLYR